MLMKKPQSTLYETIYKAVKKIPRGRVATYGDIAWSCGFREHARLVGYALHNLKSGSDVPWHRVINCKGLISLRKHTPGHERQRKLLEQEGIVFTNAKIDLARYGVRAAHPKLKRKPMKIRHSEGKH